MIQLFFPEIHCCCLHQKGSVQKSELNPNAIGYDGLGYVTPDLKVIALAKDTEDAFVLPTPETVIDNTYPIARDLYMYTNGEPTGTTKEYLNWIFTSDAQDIVSELGFVPIINP